MRIFGEKRIRTMCLTLPAAKTRRHKAERGYLLVTVGVIHTKCPRQIQNSRHSVDKLTLDVRNRNDFIRAVRGLDKGTHIKSLSLLGGKASSMGAYQQ